MNLFLFLFVIDNSQLVDTKALHFKYINCGSEINKALKVQLGKIMHEYEKTSDQGAFGQQKKKTDLRAALRRVFKTVFRSIMPFIIRQT